MASDFSIYAFSTTSIDPNEIHNNFMITSDEDTLFMCILYINLGWISILANILNIYVFVANKELRKNYIFHIFLDFGEILNGISHILTGLGRGYLFLNKTLNTPISVHDCFYKHFWPISLILGTEIISIMTMIMSAERVIAVHKPGLYGRIFRARNKVGLVLFGVFIQVILLFWAALSGLHDNSWNSTQRCSIISSTNKFFSTFHFLFVVFGYVISFVSLSTIYLIHKKKNKKLSKAIVSNKNSPQLKVFVAITFIDVILVSMPAFVMISARWDFFQPSDIAISLTHSATGLISLIHTVMNFVFYAEFRKQIRRIMKIFMEMLHLNSQNAIMPNSHAIILPIFPKAILANRSSTVSKM